MTATSNNSIGERIFALLLLAAGVSACAASVVLQLRTDGTNAGTFPLIVSALFVLFAVLNTIFVFRSAPHAPRGSLSTVLLIMLLLCGVCASLLLHVPLWNVCPVFLFFACFVILRQRLLASLITAFVTTGAIYLVFSVLLRVPLP